MTDHLDPAPPLALSREEIEALRSNADILDAWPRIKASLLLAASAEADARIVARMLELGDTRLMAADGDCGGQLPDLSPDEWGKVYRACKRIAAIDQAMKGAAR